jgi:hypothetical protein
MEGVMSEGEIAYFALILIAFAGFAVALLSASRGSHRTPPSAAGD